MAKMQSTDEHVTFLNKLKKIFRYFSKLKVKINISLKNQEPKQKTQGFGKSTWSICQKSVEKKSALRDRKPQSN